MPHATLPLWDDANTEQRIAKLRAHIDELYRYQLGAAVERVVATLRRHTPADDKESRDRDTIIALCEAHPNIFNMNCEPAHMTGSALIVHPPTQRVLLNHHKALDRWMQFGGHFDLETEPWRVALREAREESGLRQLSFLPNLKEPAPFDVDVHTIPARGERPAHLHLDLRYMVSTDAPGEAKASAESVEIRWLTFDEALALTHGSQELQRMLAKAQSIIAKTRA
jgi:8-oxo-dGTP pyrophosphatase MutT (NUDIX family)